MRKIKFPTEITLTIDVIPNDKIKNVMSYAELISKKYPQLKIASASWKPDFLNPQLVVIYEFKSHNKLNEIVKIIDILKRRKTIINMSLQVDSIKC